MIRLDLVEASDALTCVALFGRLDADGVGRIETALTDQVVARRKPAVIDITGVEFIASMGIGMLISLAKSMGVHGLGLAVVAVGPASEILKLAEMPRIFPVVGTRDEAFRALGLR
jgi:anti-anti-sigma factor